MNLKAAMFTTVFQRHSTRELWIYAFLNLSIILNIGIHAMFDEHLDDLTPIGIKFFVLGLTSTLMALKVFLPPAIPKNEK